MQAKRLPAVRGWIWIAEGLTLWRRNPMSLISVGVLLQLLMLLLFSLPGGPLIWGLLWPGLVLGLYRSARMVDAGQNATPLTMFRAVRDGGRRLLLLGSAWLLANAACAYLAVEIAGSEAVLMEFLKAQAQGGAGTGIAEMDLSPLVDTLLLLLAFSAPILMCVMFAPMLCAEAGLRPVKAVVFSFIAAWRNLRPLVVFGSMIFVLFVLAPLVIMGALAGISNVLVLVVGPMVQIVALSLIVASMYAMTKDIFGEFDASGAASVVAPAGAADPANDGRAPDGDDARSPPDQP